MKFTKIFCLAIILTSTIFCMELPKSVSAKVPVFLTIINKTDKKYTILDPVSHTIIASIAPGASKSKDVTKLWGHAGVIATGLLLFIVDQQSQSVKLKLHLTDLILSKKVLIIALIDAASGERLSDEYFEYTPGSQLGANITLTLKGEKDLRSSTLDVVGAS